MLKLWRHIFSRTYRTGLPFSPDRSVRRTRTRKQGIRAIPTIDLLEDRQLLTPTPYTVTNLNDSGLGSLRYAITQANVQDPNPDGSLIQFAQGLSGTITLSSTLALTETDGPEVISGPGASHLTVNGNNAVRVFQVNHTATLSGLTISHGRSTNGGGGVYNSGTLALAGCTLSANSAVGQTDYYSAYGGGVYNTGTLELTNCTLSANSAYSLHAGGTGGGIYNTGATMTLANCTLSNNSANEGGGGISSGGGTLNMTDCTLAGNSASNWGGGIYASGTATLVNCTLNNNSAGGAGGIYNGGTASLANCTLSHNSATNSAFADGGGGIANGGTATLTNCTLSGNSVQGRIDHGALGGGVNNSGTLELTNCTLSANSATNASWATRSTADGGGVYNTGTVELTNCTLSANSANNYANNYAAYGGGVYNYGTATLNNSIVANSLGGDIYTYEVRISGSNNLVEDGSGLPGWLTGDPDLGALKDNGGPTLTMALLPGSPANDAGSNALALDASGNPLTTDQRGAGYVRISGSRVDIGAYEFTPPIQSISFGPLSGQTYGVAPITLSATATSGLPVSFAVISGPAMLSGSVLTVTGAGNVVVEASQTGNTAYSAAAPVDVSFMVSPATLTITPSAGLSMLYGGTLPTLTYSYAGLVNGDPSANFTGGLAATATSSSGVGVYPITQGTLVATGNYTIGTFNPGKLTVTPAPLTITASDATKLYGAALPALTASYSGWVNGDTTASLAALPTLTTSATASSDVHIGGYPILASGASDPDYTISYVTGTLTVTRAQLTITADNQTKPYGAVLPTLTASYSGFVNGDTAANLLTQPNLNTTANVASHVGSYAITASDAASSDYMISYLTGTLSIIPAALTITADNKAKVYGSVLTALTASYNGLVNGDTAASLTTLPSINTTATAASHVGSYAITASGAASSDYAINYLTGTLIVTPASLTITANDTAKVYGAAVPALSATYRGFVNGDSAASLKTPPTLTTAATASSHVQTGGYAINASGASDPDYTISYLPGTFTITPAPLTITANNASKLYGAALPALAASYTGFVNGESAASLSAHPVLATSASASSSVQPGGYAIIASGASDPDYMISYQPGTLFITPAPLTITANNASMVQGAAVPPLSVCYSGFVNGDSAASLSTPPTPTTPATPLSQAGTYPIVVGGARSPNYAINYANGILVVTPAPVKVLKVSTEVVRLGKTRKTTQVIVLQFTGSLNVGTAQSIRDYSLTTIPANKRQKSQVTALSQAQYNAATNTVSLITRKPLVHNPSLKLTYNLLDAYNHSVSGSATIGN
jgi:hypothetical protein